MKKILVVGYTPYGYMRDLTESYPDVMWFEENHVGYSGAASIVELVGMFDGIMFTENSRDNLAWEVACVMNKVNIIDKKDYSLKKEENKEGNHE